MLISDAASPVFAAYFSGSWPATLLAVYCVCIAAASLAGGWLPMLIKLTHRRMQLLVSLVAGMMLGVGLLHMLPHSIIETGSVDRSMQWAMAGLLLMFALIRAFHFHSHGPQRDANPASHDHAHHHHDHDHDHVHDLQDSQAPSPVANHVHSHHLSWLGAAFGLSLHTMIDGLALAASLKAEALHSPGGWFLGVGTFLAIVLHKPLDAVSITSLMTAGGWSATSRNLVNLGFSCMAPVGALLFWVGAAQMQGSQQFFVGCAVAFAAGVFLCISLADLLPEIEFHAHDRVALSTALLLGVGVAYGIGFLEPAHLHDDSKAGQQHAPHDHAGHAH